MNKMVITKNTRISVYHSFGVWALTIQNVKPSDRGWYMCQTNTDPMESQMFSLDVTGKLNISSQVFFVKLCIYLEFFLLLLDRVCYFLTLQKTGG